MGPETVFVFQPFLRARKAGRIIAGQAVEMPSHESALRALERMNEDVVGGVVFSVRIDGPDVDWGGAKVVAQEGAVPAAFLESVGI